MVRKAYVVANLEVITDRDKFRDYERGLIKALAKHEGKLLTFSDDVHCLEGENPPKGRLVVMEFPSQEHVDAWWADIDYQAASDIRREHAVTNFIAMLEALPLRN
jgi:uncharacterized protein (DUF1330 family)